MIDIISCLKFLGEPCFDSTYSTKTKIDNGVKMLVTQLHLCLMLEETVTYDYIKIINS